MDKSMIGENAVVKNNTSIPSTVSTSWPQSQSLREIKPPAVKHAVVGGSYKKKILKAKTIREERGKPSEGQIIMSLQPTSEEDRIYREIDLSVSQRIQDEQSPGDDEALTLKKRSKFDTTHLNPPKLTASRQFELPSNQDDQSPYSPSVLLSPKARSQQHLRQQLSLRDMTTAPPHLQLRPQRSLRQMGSSVEIRGRGATATTLPRPQRVDQFEAIEYINQLTQPSARPALKVMVRRDDHHIAATAGNIAISA